MSDIAIEKKQLLSKELSREERVKWLGEPDPYRSMFPLTNCVLVGILCLSFISVIFGMVYGAHSLQSDENLPLVAWLVAALFYVTGAILILDPLWSYLNAKKAIYAITTKRAIIIDGLIFRKVRSYGKREVTQPELIHRKDEYWDVIIASKQLGYSGGQHQATVGDNAIGFKRIKNPEYLQKMLKTI